MNAFDKTFYKNLRKYQREEEPSTSKFSDQTKEFMLRNNLYYNKNTKKYDSDGNVRVRDEDLINGHLPIQLGEVGGSMIFECYDNLTSLKGCPTYVHKCFSVYHCTKLTSLQFGPEEVDWQYDCSFTSVKNLVGAPEHVGHNFYCSYCENLTSLNGLQQVDGQVWCEQCPNLKITDQDREYYQIKQKADKI